MQKYLGAILNVEMVFLGGIIGIALASPIFASTRPLVASLESQKVDCEYVLTPAAMTEPTGQRLSMPELPKPIRPSDFSDRRGDSIEVRFRNGQQYFGIFKAIITTPSVVGGQQRSRPMISIADAVDEKGENHGYIVRYLSDLASFHFPTLAPVTEEHPIAPVEHLLPDWFPTPLHVGNDVDEATRSSHYETIEAHNEYVMRKNLHNVRGIMPLLADEPAEVAVPRLFQEMMKGHIILNTSSDYWSAGANALLRQGENMMRYNNRQMVRVMNLPQIHPHHLKDVVSLYYKTLNKLIETIRFPMHEHEKIRAAYMVATWAQHMLVMIQPSIDCNTRVGRQVFNWVLQRVRLLSEVDLPIIDFTVSDVRTAAVEHPHRIGALSFKAFHPFSDDIKDFTHYQLLMGMLSRSRQIRETVGVVLSVPFIVEEGFGLYDPVVRSDRNKDYFILLDKNEIRSDPAVPTALEQYAQFDSSKLPGWINMRNYFLDILKETNLERVQSDPAVRAQTRWIMNYLRYPERMARP